MEKEVEDHTDDRLSKKFVALIVRSRIVGIRRRNEKWTSSSHERTFFYTDQQDKQTNGKCVPLFEMVWGFAVDVGQWMASMESLSVEADEAGAQVARWSFDMVGMNGDISAVELEYKMYMELIRNAKRG